jgi:hypothetical protein
MPAEPGYILGLAGCGPFAAPPLDGHRSDGIEDIHHSAGTLKEVGRFSDKAEPS